MEPTLTGKIQVSVRGGSLALAEGKGRALVIGDQPRVVGRSRSCDLVISDKEASKSHVELAATERGVLVRDLNSTNGTWLGKTRIREVFLTSSVRLRIGQTELQFTPAKPESRTLPKRECFGELVGQTQRMLEIFEILSAVAPTETTILLTGETGTGKERAAKAIHDASARSKRKFQTIDCGAIPASLAESELFGHRKGSFTGAIGDKQSPFVDADGGTIFLDEIGELPLDVQPKLLRVLQEKQIKPVGANSYRRVDVRIIAATRADLLVEVNAKRFRDDLYYRLRGVVVELPPLRERREDIESLVKRILEDNQRPDAALTLPDEALDLLTRHDWPGNVRELAGVVKLAVDLSRGGAIDLKRAYEMSRASESRTSKAQEPNEPTTRSRRGSLGTFAAAERAYYQRLYAEQGPNLSRMAEYSGVTRTTIRSALERFGIAKDRPDGRTVGRRS